MGFWERFLWCYTWWCLVCRYHYLSSLLLWIYKHLSRAVRMLPLQRGRSRIEIQGLNRSCLLLFLQWWMRRGILWKWPWLLDEVLLDILVCRDLCWPISLYQSSIHGLRRHRLDKFEVLWVHSTLLFRRDSLFDAPAGLSLIVNQEVHQSIYILGRIVVIAFMKEFLSWCHPIFIEDKNI